MHCPESETKHEGNKTTIRNFADGCKEGVKGRCEASGPNSGGATSKLERAVTLQKVPTRMVRRQCLARRRGVKGGRAANYVQRHAEGGHTRTYAPRWTDAAGEKPRLSAGGLRLSLPVIVMFPKEESFRLPPVSGRSSVAAAEAPAHRIGGLAMLCR